MGVSNIGWEKSNFPVIAYKMESALLEPGENRSFGRKT